MYLNLPSDVHEVLSHCCIHRVFTASVFSLLRREWRESGFQGQQGATLGTQPPHSGLGMTHSKLRPPAHPPAVRTFPFQI